MTLAREENFPESLINNLTSLLGSRNVLTEPHQRAMRAMTPAPFPLHRWKDHVPDVVVLPGSTEDVSNILKLANDHKVPVVPRSGGTGLNDGAVPLRKGIVVDMKRLDQILEVDEDNMAVTTQTGINNQELSRSLKKFDLWWPFDPASFPVSIIGGNIGTGAWSLISGISGHIPDLVLSMIFVLPTGQVIQVGEGGGRKVRKSSTGYRLKDLFIGHQGTLGIATEATLDVFPRPEAEFSAFFGFESFEDGYANLGKMSKSFLRTMAAVAMLDEDKLNFLRRDDEAYIALSPKFKSVIATAFYGTEAEVRAASKRIFEIAKLNGGEYLGEELSEGDWASRHDRYHLALHGRDLKGNVMPSTWHDEDAAIIYTELPAVRSEWKDVVKEYNKKYGIFDYGGAFFYNNSPFRPWGDYLAEMDIFIPEMELDDEKWGAWVELTKKISEISINHQGSISAAHGATRPGQDEMIRLELQNGMYDLMKSIKRTLDPNNIMNPGKFGLDAAYSE